MPIDDSDPQKPADYGGIGKLLTDGALDSLARADVLKAALSMLAHDEAAKFALGWKLFLDGIEFVATKYEQGEQAIAPIAERAVGPIIGGLFGGAAGAADFSKRMAAGGGDDAAKSIVEGFMRAIAGGAAGPVEPGTEGATRIASAAVAASIESTINALIPELVSDFLPFDLGKITALTDLPEGVLRSLGVGRLVRRALTPLVNATCTTPATWYYNKLYRQTLLGPAIVAKQVARDRMSQEEAAEVFARHGYTDKDMEAIINDSLRFMGISELWLLVRAQQWSESDAVQHLKDQGWDDGTATTLVTVERLKQIEAFDTAMADAAVTAYADGRIDEGTLGGFCSGTTITDQHKAQLVELAHARRICNQKPLTAAEAKAAVIAGILALPDYRAALEREGRDETAVTVLELLLRQELDAKKSIADHKAELAQEKADAAAKKQADALAKKQAADAKAAEAQLGPPAQLEAAYIRGLIPLDRVEQVYRGRYDAGAVDALLALVEAKRQDYVDQQAKAAAAKQRAASRGVDVGQLEAAVLTGVITADEYGRRLGELKFDDADVQVLVGTVQAKLAAQQQRDAAHAAAVAAAKVKHIDLPTLELLVRRGHRSLADFRATLAALGYDDVAQAALVERLQIAIQDDADKAALRKAAEAKLQDKGLTLEQMRRAVILGFKSTQDYAGFLLKSGVTADAVATLVQEVSFDADQAKAAAEKRAAAAARSQSRAAPLADVHRAARLGLIPVDVYTVRLQTDGYTADAIALELDLLTLEIADVQAARAKRTAADAKATDRGLTLAQTAAAVKAHELPIGSYTDRAIALGLSADDADVLTRVLQDELDAAAATAARKQQLADADPALELRRADVEKAVKDGLKTLDDYGAWLTEEHYAPEDVALLVAELQQTVNAAAAKAAGGTAG